MKYTNCMMELWIDEYIHNKRNRSILKDHYLDGETHEQIAEKYDMSTRQVSNICLAGMDEISKYDDFGLPLIAILRYVFRMR